MGECPEWPLSSFFFFFFTLFTFYFFFLFWRVLRWSLYEDRQGGPLVLMRPTCLRLFWVPRPRKVVPFPVSRALDLSAV